jgi:hypothetical protein
MEKDLKGDLYMYRACHAWVVFAYAALAFGVLEYLPTGSPRGMPGVIAYSGSLGVFCLSWFFLEISARSTRGVYRQGVLCFYTVVSIFSGAIGLVYWAPDWFGVGSVRFYKWEGFLALCGRGLPVILAAPLIFFILLPIHAQVGWFRRSPKPAPSSLLGIATRSRGLYGFSMALILLEAVVAPNFHLEIGDTLHGLFGRLDRWIGMEQHSTYSRSAIYRELDGYMFFGLCAAPLLFLGVIFLHRGIRHNVLSHVREGNRKSRQSCRSCGYSLRGLPSSSCCPECGSRRRR